MVKVAYVSGGRSMKTEFEVHGADCSHLPKLKRDRADVTIMEVESAQALVDSEVDYYQDNGQGYDHEDFRILPCAKAAGRW